MITCTDTISRNKMKQWQEIFNDTNGRYINTPYLSNNRLIVHYEYKNTDDYIEFCYRCNTLFTNIVEKHSDQWYRKVWNRIKYLIKRGTKKSK